MRRLYTVGLVAALGLVACEVEGELDEIYEEDVDDMARFGPIGTGGFGDGPSCTVTETGNFDIESGWESTGSITTGCEDGEICIAFACNNAIPQTCYGNCADGGGFPGW